MTAALRQFVAELVRAPVLLGVVLPELVRARVRERSLVGSLWEHAGERPEALALITDAEQLSYRELLERVLRRASWLVRRGIGPGDAVLIVGGSGAEYVSLLLACSAIGASAALSGAESSRALCERARGLSSPKLVLSNAAASTLLGDATVVYDAPAFLDELAELDPMTFRALPAEARDFARIFTSGTTGPSKLCRISEKYALFASTVFARLVHRLGPRDRVYCCLPLHHASGLLLGLGACLVAGVPLVLRERFSARAFFDDVRRFDATVALYIGEIGRALCALPPSTRDREHGLRLMTGNGMSPVAWAALRDRFGVPEIAEFYAQSEFPGSIVNLTGKLGSVGHVPFERQRGYRLVRVSDDGEPLRGEDGFASEPDVNEPGELMLRVRAPAAFGNERVVRNLFRTGDAYLRSGDLLRRDRERYYWFVDRLGDAYRFKGELVSTRDVEDHLEAEGVRGVSIVGVAVSGVDGKVGLAVARAEGFDRERFLTALTSLPDFARPRFLRFASEFELGPSYKLKKRKFASEGVAPSALTDPVYLLKNAEIVAFDATLYAAVRDGALRL